MVYLTDTATTTDSRDVYFPLNLVCVRERERGTRTTMERSGLPPSLPPSPVAGISIWKTTGELQRRRFRRGGGGAGWGGELWSRSQTSF